MPYPPTPTNAWDITQPPDTQLLNQGALDLRNVHVDVMQRLAQLSGTIANRPTPETVNATWGGSGFGLTYFATDTKQIFQWNGSAWVELGYSLPTVGGTVLSPGVTGNLVVWRAPFACTVTRLWGFIDGSTGSTINALHNFSNMFNTLTLGTADTWIDGGAPTSGASFAVGDNLGFQVLSVSGSPNFISFQVNFTRP